MIFSLISVWILLFFTAENRLSSNYLGLSVSIEGANLTLFLASVMSMIYLLWTLFLLYEIFLLLLLLLDIDLEFWREL